MHERVWGRRGPRGGIEGGPAPRTSLAHGGRRQSEGRGPPAPGPGPAPGPTLQSSTARAAVAAAALWSQPRLVPAEGRRAAAPPGPLALSGRRPRGGACCSPASPLSRVLHRSSRHSERGAPKTWMPLLEGLGLGAERWAFRRAPWSPSGCCGHPASSDGVEPLVRAGCRGRLLRKEAGRPCSRRSWASISPSPGRTTAFLPGRRAAMVELAPSRGRTACRSSRRPRVPGYADHCHPRARIPRCFAGVRPPVRQSPARERYQSQLLYWSPCETRRSPKFLSPANL